MPIANTGKLENYQVYTDTQALNDLKMKAKNDEKSALKPVAEQFESLFVEQILKEARKVKLDDGWLDSDKADFYKDWYDKQLSQSISAKGGLGLADTIVEQLAPKQPTMSQSEYEAYKLAEKKTGKGLNGLHNPAAHNLIHKENLIKAKPSNTLQLTQDRLAVRGLGIR